MNEECNCISGGYISLLNCFKKEYCSFLKLRKIEYDAIFVENAKNACEILRLFLPDKNKNYTAYLFEAKILDKFLEDFNHRHLNSECQSLYNYTDIHNFGLL